METTVKFDIFDYFEYQIHWADRCIPQPNADQEEARMTACCFGSNSLMRLQTDSGMHTLEASRGNAHVHDQRPTDEALRNRRI